MGFPPTGRLYLLNQTPASLGNIEFHGIPVQADFPPELLWSEEMVLHLDSRAERLIEEQLHSGRFHSPEEVVARALEALASGSSSHPNAPNQVIAVRSMIDFAEQHRLTLGDELTVRDLINEGRKY